MTSPPIRPTPLPPHLQIYTWPTLTLRELSHLLTSALPSLLPNPVIGTRLAYRLIYPDTASSGGNPQSSSAGRFLSKDLGSVIVAPEDSPAGTLPDDEGRKYVTGGVMAGPLEGEPEKTLQEARFVIGDFIDCCILPPGRDGSVVGPPPVRGRGAVADAPLGRTAGRENGYGNGGWGVTGAGEGGEGLERLRGGWEVEVEVEVFRVESGGEGRCCQMGEGQDIGADAAEVGSYRTVL